MATYYVETGHGGTDSGTQANPWLTIQQAANAVAAGDKVWVKASGTYNEQVTLATAGGYNSPITWEGYTSTTGDGGVVTISGGGTRTYCVSGANKSYQYWKNFKFDNATSDGYYDDGADYGRFVNCTFSNNGRYGLRWDNYCILENCVAEGNTNHGLYVDLGYMFRCVIRDNGGEGSWGQNSLYYNCEAYGNTNAQLASATYVFAFNNTVDGEGGASSEGIHIGTSFQVYFGVNNIVYDCNVGVSTDSTDRYPHMQLLNYNLVNSNTTQYDASLASHIGANDVTTAPAFTNEASHDYTLGSSSPARNAGADASGTSAGMDIGAHQSQDSGGGKTVITG